MFSLFFYLSFLMMTQSLFQSSSLFPKNGFYGLIGPNIDPQKVSTLYELFIADGIIQGVFFKNGEPTFKTFKINTDKRKFEKKFGKIPQNLATTFFLFLFNKWKILPNLAGTANTAIMRTPDCLFALFERDLPYKLKIDFLNQEINTLSRLHIPRMDTFSAHSKIINGEIHTLDYDILFRRVYYYILDLDFKIKKKVTISTSYLPVIHDFVVLGDSIIFMDSPFYFNRRILFSAQMPVSFNEKSSTKIHIYNLTSDSVRTVELPKGTFIFHYADFQETENHIDLFASLYESLNFSSVKIHGKYRKIRIHKGSPQVEIEIDPDTDQYDLEFPVSFTPPNNSFLNSFFDKMLNPISNPIPNPNTTLHPQILLHLGNGGFDGVFVIEALKIKKKIFMKNKMICGEPAVFYEKKHPFLIGFSYDVSFNGYLFVIDLISFEIREFNLHQKMTIGFHSIYITF